MAKQNSSLTAREQEVLVLIAQGRTAQQIGDTLGIVKRTVHAHASSIVKKLNAANWRTLWRSQ